jgi:glyoxylase-like metal-dependent hydrolase (beta-lactamase superfamily II)
VTDVQFLDLEFLGHPGVIGTGVLRGRDGVWLVDPGPSSALAGLEKGLAAHGVSLADVRGLLLTHIHLDHAGATGTIVRRYPGMRVFVHQRGAPHMADPSRLLESAGRLYAGDLERLWGEVAPVPAGSMTALEGGETLDCGGRSIDVAYTPGHASHHVSYFDRHTGGAYVGDTGGVRLAPGGHVIAPTPPPDIDLQAWTSSLDRIGQWKPARLYLTHFGMVERPDEHFAAFRPHLFALADLCRVILNEPGTDQERMDRFVGRVSADLCRAMPAAEARRYQLAVPLEHCWLGLARYWRKKTPAPPV